MLVLPPLPYSYDALEPVLSAKSVRLHHDVLQARYVDGFNRLLQNQPELRSYGTVGTMFLNLDSLRRLFGPQVAADVEFFGGGAANHAFYWSVTDPLLTSSPSPALVAAAQCDFGGVGAMVQALREISGAIRGSGWGWVVYDLNEGRLRVVSTREQTSPLVNHQFPVIGVDVWEHAYYLDYNADRSEYLDRWSHLINWQFASAAFAQAVSHG